MSSKLSAPAAKMLLNSFYRNMKFLEIWIEKANFYSDFPKWGQVKDRWEGWGKVWKDKQATEIKNYFFSSLYFMYGNIKMNKEKDGFREIVDHAKQDFYRWIDGTRIKNVSRDLKSTLLIFHEILEGLGDQWAKEKAEKSIKEVESWSKEKLQFENERTSAATNETQEEIEREMKSLEGKNWNEITLENKFKGNAESGRKKFFQIISSPITPDNTNSSDNQPQTKHQSKPKTHQIQNLPSNKFNFWWVAVPLGVILVVGIVLVFCWIKKNKNYE